MSYISGCLDQIKSSIDDTKVSHEILDKLASLQVQVANLTQELNLLRSSTSPSTVSSELTVDCPSDSCDLLNDDEYRYCSSPANDEMHHRDDTNDIIDSYFWR